MTTQAEGLATRAAPVQEDAEIFDRQTVGEYVQFTLVAPGIAAGFRSGQFVAVAVGGPDTSMLLRRSFALYGVRPGTDFAGTVQIVVALKGRGTHWLLSRRIGERLNLLGPLGEPFTLPADGAAAVLVGGGYGVAPLLPLAETLLAQGSELEMLVGASTAGRLFGELAARRLIGQVTVTTDDGSAGQRGRVTDPLAASVRRLGARQVYACGPMAMLRAVSEVAAAEGVAAQVAVEESMACGIGVCMTCVLPVRDGGGTTRFVRSCVEGPVFQAAAVRWGDVGRLPADVFGADGM